MLTSPGGTFFTDCKPVHHLDCNKLDFRIKAHDSRSKSLEISGRIALKFFRPHFKDNIRLSLKSAAAIRILLLACLQRLFTSTRWQQAYGMMRSLAVSGWLVILCDVAVTIDNTYVCVSQWQIFFLSSPVHQFSSTVSIKAGKIHAVHPGSRPDPRDRRTLNKSKHRS